MANLNPTVPHAKLGKFRPWMSNLIWIFYGLVFTWLAWLFLFSNGYIGAFIAACSASMAFIVWNWKTFMARSHGQRVEARAVKALEKIVGNRLEKGLVLPGRGDIDAVVTLQDQRFNIEIKSIQSVAKVTAKHAQQCLAASHYLKTTPVIWLPDARFTQISQKNGVHIFAGNAKEFSKYLGC